MTSPTSGREAQTGFAVLRGRFRRDAAPQLEANGRTLARIGAVKSMRTADDPPRSLRGCLEHATGGAPEKNLDVGVDEDFIHHAARHGRRDR